MAPNPLSVWATSRGLDADGEQTKLAWALFAEVGRLRDALLGVQLSEINGRLCARPEPPDPWFDDPSAPRESRCCDACRELWEQIDAALRPEEVE